MTHKSYINESNEIVLRPRFQLELPYNNQLVLKAFEKVNQVQSDFLINRIDDHIFIKYPKIKQQYWTPQLHLEINIESDRTSKLYGLFGPKPSVWLLFMFFHFVIAMAFLGSGIWTYTNWSLGNSYLLQIVIAIMMIVIWIALYIFGRMGRSTAKSEMRELKLFMNKVLETIDNNNLINNKSSNDNQ